MTSKHTPGPWEAHGATVYAGEVALALAYCEGWREDMPQMPDRVPDGQGTREQDGIETAWANAALFAAAPEMRDAIGHIISAIDANDSHGIREEVDAARTLLARLEV